VFPIQATDGKKVPAAGLGSAATSADVQATQDVLRRQGGVLAVADASGEFELELPAAGTYPLLVLSKSQRRDPAKEIDAELKRLLESLFDRPQLVPGEIRFYFGRVRYDANGTEIWDHSFEGE
jgi:hypothetical protein